MFLVAKFGCTTSRRPGLGEAGGQQILEAGPCGGQGFCPGGRLVAGAAGRGGGLGGGLGQWGSRETCLHLV